MRVIVVGAGVVGLSCAVRLREAGLDAHVLARDLPPETTSAVAAAIWYPYRALPHDKVLAWSTATYTELARLAEQEPTCGVSIRWGTELLRSAAAAPPWWRDAVPTVDRLADPPEGFAGGWRLAVPVADMSVYLPWLVGRLDALGGTLTRSWLPVLPDRGLVVNCSGLAARVLAADASVHPVRGQVVLVEQFGLTEWLLEQSDERELTYVVPRSRDVVVGGTALEHVYDPHPDPETARAIIDRAARLVPEIARARVRGHRVGLRPARHAVRLDSERTDAGHVVHCYGHGGAGVTLSWGCADDVVREVQQVLAPA